MPCNADYMSPTPVEISTSRVLALLDELSCNVLSKHHYSGYHPLVYCRQPTKALLDALTAELCTKLKTTDVTKYSLEMQMWWRNHQAADAARKD